MRRHDEEDYADELAGELLYEGGDRGFTVEVYKGAEEELTEPEQFSDEWWEDPGEGESGQAMETQSVEDSGPDVAPQSDSGDQVIASPSRTETKGTRRSFSDRPDHKALKPYKPKIAKPLREIGLPSITLPNWKSAEPSREEELFSRETTRRMRQW